MYTGYTFCSKGCWETKVLYDWDDKKDEAKRAQYGFGFAEVMKLFESEYYQEDNESYPHQFRVVGFSQNAVMVTVVCEDRTDEDGNEITWLATFWKSSSAERKKYEEAHRLK